MSKFHGAKAGYEAGKQFLKNIFKPSKVSPTITKVDPFVPKTKAEKTARDLRRAKQKRKTSEVKLDDTLFRIDQQKKRLKGERVYSGKELEQQEYFKYKKRDKKMGGGFMGKRMGYSKGTPKPKTNVEKIKEAFGSKKGLKKIDPKKQKGLAKLKKARPDVVRKMGYFKKGGVS